MSAWCAEVAIGIGASFAATLLVKATLTLAVALTVTGLARRSRAAARHVLLVAAFAVLLALPTASFVMPSRGVALPARPAVSPAPVTTVVPVMTSPAPTHLGAQESGDTFRIDSGMTASALVWTVWGAGALLSLLPVFAGTWACARCGDPARRAPAAARCCAGCRPRRDCIGLFPCGCTNRFPVR